MGARQYLIKTVTESDKRHFIAWLEKKPARETYDYHESTECLLAQYLRDSGFTRVIVSQRSFYHNTAEGSLPLKFNEIASTRPHTFGAALSRAKTAL